MGMEVELLDKIDPDFLEKQKITSAISPETGKVAYSSGSILAKTTALLPEIDGYCLLSITNKDIYHRTPDNWVFGLGDSSLRTGVFSFLRYDPAF